MLAALDRGRLLHLLGGRSGAAAVIKVAGQFPLELGTFQLLHGVSHLDRGDALLVGLGKNDIDFFERPALGFGVEEVDLCNNWLVTSPVVLLYN